MNARRFGCVVFGLVVVLVGCATVSDIHDATVDIDEPEEIELGRAVTTGLGAHYTLLRDEALTRYVALVGNGVALRSDRPDLRYYFGVFDTDEVNAFAAPGGYVFITRGTLKLMRDEATLAAVLGHEIGHIALRHHNETIKDQKKAAATKSVGMSILDIGSGFIPGAAGTAVGIARSTGIINLMADGLVNATLAGWSRGQEEQADVVGFKYATRAGYDAAGLRDFLQAVQASGSAPTSKTFFATHPGAADRLKEQEDQLKTAPAGGRRAAARFQQAMAAMPAAR